MEESIEADLGLQTHTSLEAQSLAVAMFRKEKITVLGPIRLTVVNLVLGSKPKTRI